VASGELKRREADHRFELLIKNEEEHWGGRTPATTKGDQSEYLGFRVHCFLGKETGQGRLVEQRRRSEGV